MAQRKGEPNHEGLMENARASGLALVRGPMSVPSFRRVLMVAFRLSCCIEERLRVLIDKSGGAL